MFRRLLLGLCALCLMSSCVAMPGSNKTSNGAKPAASTTTTAPRPPAATPSAGTPSGAVRTTCLTETTDSYQRPFSANAPWNVPVCGLAQDARSADWANRFWYYSHYNRFMGGDITQSTDLGDHGIMFGLDDDAANDFSVAVYDRADATTTARVFQRDGWNGGFNIGNGGSIPWNPSWRASTGSDAILVVIDYTTGQEWSLWGLAQSVYGMPVNDTQCWQYLTMGYRRHQDLCAGGANLSKNSTNATPIDVRTYGGNNPTARGGGIDEYAMLTTPQEVATGQIRHALMMPVFNTMNGGTGQVCSAAQQTTAAFGSTCGSAVAPAGQFENRSITSHGCGNNPPAAALSDTAYRQTTLPEGTRFALNLSDADIETWLNSRGYTGQKRITAKAFAVALVNYGWFITDTSCFAAEFQVAGGANPDTAGAWRSLGITGDGRDLLDGLFKKDSIWTVAPPTNHCANGTDSKFFCPADSSTYP